MVDFFAAARDFALLRPAATFATCFAVAVFFRPETADVPGCCRDPDPACDRVCDRDFASRVGRAVELDGAAASAFRAVRAALRACDSR